MPLTLLSKIVAIGCGVLLVCPVVLAQHTTPTLVSAVTASSIEKPSDDAEYIELAEMASLLDETPAKQEHDASASSNDAGPVGIVPIEKGFNATLATTSQHDSAAGWQSVLTPDLAYRFNKYFSVNTGIPVFAYLLMATQTAASKVAKPPATPVYVLEPGHFLLGDLTMTGQFEVHTKVLDYTFDAAMGVPTGDDADGLGAGQVIYTLNNHFEHEFGWFTPDIELGIGDSPNLDDARLKKSYITVGEGAHFQAGATFSLWKGITFASEAYEDLPLGTQTVTTTTTNGKKGKQLRVITTSTQKSLGEDNGFLNSLDIPIGNHVTLSGIYNRSLREKDDTAGFSITFSIKSTKHNGSDHDDAK